nr:hypothetical protein 6 [bacterium]
MDKVIPIRPDADIGRPDSFDDEVEETKAFIFKFSEMFDYTPEHSAAAICAHTGFLLSAYEFLDD